LKELSDILDAFSPGKHGEAFIAQDEPGNDVFPAFGTTGRFADHDIPVGNEWLVQQARVRTSVFLPHVMHNVRDAMEHSLDQLSSRKACHCRPLYRTGIPSRFLPAGQA
jgi:hypothetical protein